MGYFNNLAVCASQFLNVVAGGQPDETLCSRAYRKSTLGELPATLFCKAANKVFFWEEDHCKDSYDAVVEQRHTDANIVNARRVLAK